MRKAYYVDPPAPAGGGRLDYPQVLRELALPLQPLQVALVLQLLVLHLEGRLEHRKLLWQHVGFGNEVEIGL